jgi:ABC-type uncharacterized transport system substrate-binding protein
VPRHLRRRWTDGQNTRIEYRWPGGDIEQIQSLAKELVGSRPDVLVGLGQAGTAALQQATRTIPIVFLMSVDPVAQGIVESLAHPRWEANGWSCLKGANPANLPVQTQTKFALVINLKTANALGLTVPVSLLDRADEVIE